jgi:hypothetical protein
MPRLLPLLALPLALAACHAAPSRPPAPDAGPGALVASPEPPPAPSLTAAAPPPPPRVDPDGNDDPVDTGTGPFPEHARFERIGRPPLALRRMCHLTPFRGALYAAHANEPLDMDGATITRYDPKNEAQPFTVAFDWNRPGEPTKNGGAGQGFLRVHAIEGRLYVPDADPPYNGFEITEPGTEGYVYMSDRAGVFAPAKMPHHRLPDAPDADGGAGAGILPRAYHVLDVIRYQGRLYASTGSVPPGQRAWHGPSPGALHVASADLSRWTFEVDYPDPWQDGVWRFTFMVRYKGRLYAGLQDYDGTEPNDFVYADPPEGSVRLTQADLHSVRVTRGGTARTLRWYADDGKLYWIAWARDGVKLRVTEDGDTWRVIGLPRNAGAPADISRFRGVLVVLTERGLFRIDRDPPEAVAMFASQDGRTPFEVHDHFCTSPLGVLDGVLYAGSQRDGALYRIAETDR